jgi:hypothetical protein
MSRPQISWALVAILGLLYAAAFAASRRSPSAGQVLMVMGFLFFCAGGGMLPLRSISLVGWAHIALGLVLMAIGLTLVLLAPGARRPEVWVVFVLLLWLFWFGSKRKPRD